MDCAAEDLANDRIDAHLFDADVFQITVASARTPPFTCGRIRSTGLPTQGGRHVTVLVIDQDESDRILVDWSTGFLHLTPALTTGYRPVEGRNFQTNWIVQDRGIFTADPTLEQRSAIGLDEDEGTIYREVARVVRSMALKREGTFRRDFVDLPALLTKVDGFVAEVEDGPWTRASLLVVGADPRGRLTLEVDGHQGSITFGVDLARTDPGDLAAALADRGLEMTVDRHSAGSGQAQG